MKYFIIALIATLSCANPTTTQHLAVSEKIQFTSLLISQVREDLHKLRPGAKIIAPIGLSRTKAQELEKVLRMQEKLLQDRLIDLTKEAGHLHRDNNRPCHEYCKAKLKLLEKDPERFGIFERKLRAAMDCKLCWNGYYPTGKDFGYPEPEFSEWVEDMKEIADEERAEFRAFIQSDGFIPKGLSKNKRHEFIETFINVDEE